MGAKLGRIFRPPQKRKHATTVSDLKSKSVMKHQKEAFLDSDLYSEPIQVYFKNERKMTSCIGAFISLIIRLGVLTYLGTRLIGFYNNTVSEIYTTQGQIPDTLVNFRESDDFQFMIGFNNVWSPQLGYFNMTIDNYL